MPAEPLSSLPGPSRRITVEPITIPAPPAIPDETPAAPPAVPEPAEPVPAAR